MPASTKQKSHLIQRGTRYHCRMDVPADLRHAFGNRKVLSKSLKTGDKLLAKELSSIQVGQWKAQFRAIRDTKLKSGDKWREELAAASTARIENQTNHIKSLLNGDTASPRPVDIAQFGETALEIIQELISNGHLALAQEAQALVIDTLTPPTEGRDIGQSITLTDKWSKLEAMMAAVAAQEDFNLSNSESEEALEIALRPNTYKPKSPISSTSIDTFAAAFASQNANVRTRDIYIAQIRRFSKWLTIEGKILDWDAVAEYLDSLGSVRQTRQGHLASLRKFHKWAIRYDKYYRDSSAADRNPFDNHDHARVGTNAGENWAAFTRVEVENLHSAAITNGSPDLADLIAFAAYTGCRIEEIGRIRSSTTIFKDNQPFAFLVDEAKSKAGIREIPIHAALLPVYTRRLENPFGESQFLFKGNDSHKHSLRLNALSQRFSKLKKSLGFDRLHVFHSIRKTMITLMQQAKVEPMTIPFIVGHETGMITFDIYSGGPTLEQKAAAIECLEYDFFPAH